MNKRSINKIAAGFGFEVHRHIPRDSHSARLNRMLTHHDIDLVLDVGANVGDYAIGLRDLGYMRKIISFEPIPQAYEGLLAASQKDPRWEVGPRAALGAEDGTITIHISRNSYSSSVLDVEDDLIDVAPDIAYISTETVPLRRIDGLVTEQIEASSSVFLKIDVQGFERQVLEGATGILPRIKGIQVELSLVPIYKGQCLYREMLDHIVSLGYELHAIIPGFTDASTGRMLQMDGVFFRD